MIAALTQMQLIAAKILEILAKYVVTLGSQQIVLYLVLMILIRAETLIFFYLIYSFLVTKRGHILINMRAVEHNQVKDLADVLKNQGKERLGEMMMFI